MPDIVTQQQRCGCNTIQLCDRLTHGNYQQLREELPGIRIVQVVHVTGAESVQDACEVESHVDAILLDSGRPLALTKELGGTGRAHDWTISRKITQQVSKPVLLAGGLTADNVAKAISVVKPDGLDVCSGVRSKGKLDERKLERFIAVVRSC